MPPRVPPHVPPRPVDAASRCQGRRRYGYHRSRMGHDSESAEAASSPYKPRMVLAGRYQVRRELGRGGMGIVLLCRDLVADERVALKLLIRPGVKMRPEDTWWFREEARALASLSHPAIVRARDFGQLEDGTPYLAMDAVPGRSLHEWIYLAHTDGLLPWPIVWSCIDKVLAALAHAHARGVIHGDLKPSNVLLDILPDGGQPTTHVLDLGLAWLMQDRVDHRLDGGRAAEPTVRWGAGTPGWMAPEQIRFAAPHIGPPTDLYALGCILFALLSDREPYTGTNEELLQQHKSAAVPEPRPPAGRAARGGAVRDEAAWPSGPGTASSSRPTRAASGGGGTRPSPARARRPRRRCPSCGSRARPSPSGKATGSAPEINVAAEPQPTTTGLLHLRPSPFVARSFERAKLLEIVADVAERGRAPDAAPLGRGGRGQEPPRRVALRGGARARADGPAPRALPEDRGAARRDRGRRHAALPARARRPRHRREGADEPLGGPRRRRGGEDLGRRDVGVDPSLASPDGAPARSVGRGPGPSRSCPWRWGWAAGRVRGGADGEAVRAGPAGAAVAHHPAGDGADRGQAAHPALDGRRPPRGADDVRGAAHAAPRRAAARAHGGGDRAQRGGGTDRAAPR